MQVDATHEVIPVGPPALVPAAVVSGLAVAAVLASILVAWRLARRWRAGTPCLDWRPHAPVPWEGVDVAVVLALYLASVGVVGAWLPTGSSLPQLLVANLATLALTTVGAVLLLRGRGADWRALGWSFGPAGWPGEMQLAVGGLALVLAPLLGLASLLDRIVPYRHPLVDLLMADRSPTTLAIVFVSAVVAAPIAEEFFFRRVLQGWLETRLPWSDAAAAVVASAACFAAAHAGQGLAYVPLFVLGLVLGHIARRTGSIVACTLLHALFNAVSVAIVLLTTQPAA